MLLNNYNQFKNRIPVTFKLKGSEPLFGLLVFGSYNQWYIWSNMPSYFGYYLDEKNARVANRMGLFDCLALGRSWVKGNKGVESIEYLGRFFTRHDSHWIQETYRPGLSGWAGRTGWNTTFSTTSTTPGDTFVSVSPSDPNNTPVITFNPTTPVARPELNYANILRGNDLGRRIRPMAGLRDLISRRRS